MASFDLYAVEAASIGEARALIERLLCRSLEERDSSYYRGPFYSCGQIGEENFQLNLNLDPFEDVPNEDDFPEHPILLYVNDTKRSEALKDALSKSNGAVHLLRHEEL